MAALGLLGRPAPAGLLGPGVPDLLTAGLVIRAAGRPSRPRPARLRPAHLSSGVASSGSAPVGAVSAAAPPSSGRPSLGAGDEVVPTSTYLAETAAGLLDAAARTDLHRRLAELTPPAEAAQHLAAAGDHQAALPHAP